MVKRRGNYLGGREALAEFDREIGSLRRSLSDALEESEAFEARQAELQQEQAEAYKARVVAEAEGDAARFNAVYEQYRNAKDVTRERMYLEAMEDILADMPKMILDTRGSQGALPYLPLDQLKKRNAQ